ncbi:MAG TPA: hypothetical protein VM639_03415 [Dongiaceae bacterium]|nr:hypothetical protein [Dongiaceae bacterium]
MNLRMTRFRTMAVAVGILAMLAGCATDENYHPAPGEKMRISRNTMEGFKEYQGIIGSTRLGAFAVSSDGGAYAYWYCPELACTDGNAFAVKALRDCRRYGEKCYIFARQNDIKVDYFVAP